MTETTTHIESISIRFLNLGFPLLVILSFGAVAFSIWYYHTAVPQPSGFMKRLLITIRALALIFLITGLAEPVVKAVKTVTRKSYCAVLIDTSSSMDQPDDPGRKAEALETLRTLRSYPGEHCLYRSFDSRIHDIDPAEITFEGTSTDINGAIEAVLDGEDVSSVILISDGRWNFGENPDGAGLTNDIPINSIAVGSRNTVNDIILQRISASSVGYDGMTIPVEIFVSSTNPLNLTFRVEIQENMVPVVSDTVSFGGGNLSKAFMKLPLNGPGEHTFTAVISGNSDEPSDNNVRSFAVHVLKSAFRVLVIADAPSPDLAFFRRVIESDDAFEGMFVVSDGLREPYTDPYPGDISQFDAFTILDGGGTVLTSERADALAQKVSEGAGLLVLGSTPFGENVSGFQRILPVTFSKSVDNQKLELYMELTENGRSHFITAGIHGGGRENEWNELPPVKSIATVRTTAPSGLVLVNASSADGKRTLPAVVAGKHGEGKTVVMPLSGIWRWNLMMEGAGRSGGFFKEFVKGTLRWLTSGTESSPLTVTTDSRIYLNGERIMFEGRLFDSIYSSVSSADISLTIDDNPSSKIMLEEKNPSVYTGVLQSASPGDHTFSAAAYVGGKLFAESSGDFTVEEFSLEMLDPTPDHAVLHSIATLTGGLSVTLSGIDSVLTGISPAVSSERLEEDHYIALNPLMPLLAVLLFAVEWGIRKQRGML